MTYYVDANWTRVYQYVLESYNNTPHCSVHYISLNDVNETNIGPLLEVMRNSWRVQSSREKLFNFGDVVRIAALKRDLLKLAKKLH